jgi:hypothetical protein
MCGVAGHMVNHLSFVVFSDAQLSPYLQSMMIKVRIVQFPTAAMYVY